MSKLPTAKSIADEAGISPSYASMILGGQRVPPKSLAIAIFRKLNWKHPTIKKMSDEEMAVFERHEPWTAPRDRPEQSEKAAAA